MNTLRSCLKQLMDSGTPGRRDAGRSAVSGAADTWRAAARADDETRRLAALWEAAELIGAGATPAGGRL
jgi:hypothetical protein